MRKFFLVALTFVAALALAACNGDKKATAYGLVHGHYVGEVTVTVANDKVKDVKIEEYFLPYSWAKVSNEPGDLVVVVDGSKGASNYAKYIKIGDKLFTAEVLGEAKSQTINYKADGVANLEEYVKTHDNAKWYVDQVKADKFFVANASGVKETTLTRNDATSNTSMKKSESGYWPKGDKYPLGWSGNVEAMIEAFVGEKLTATETTKDATSKKWSFGTVETGATLTDFADYYKLAKAAYEQASK